MKGGEVHLKICVNSTPNHLIFNLNPRIFVNRSVSMDRIKYVGFDMDHTLVGKTLTS